MRYFQLTSFIVFAAMTSNVYGMENNNSDNEEQKTTTPQQKSNAFSPSLKFSKEFIDSLKAQIIKNNFTKNIHGYYSPNKNYDPFLESKMRNLISIYPGDNFDLEVMLAELLFDKDIDKHQEGLSLCAQAFILECYKKDFQKGTTFTSGVAPSTYYFNLLHQNLLKLEITGNKFQYSENKFITNFNKAELFFSCLEKRDFKEYIIKNKIKCKNNLMMEKQLKENFLECAKYIFSHIMLLIPEERSSNPFYDTYFLYFKSKLKHLGYDSLHYLGDLSDELYKAGPKEEEKISPFLRLTYAEYHLYLATKDKKIIGTAGKGKGNLNKIIENEQANVNENDLSKGPIREAIRLFKSVLEADEKDLDYGGYLFKTFHNYNTYGLCLDKNEQYEEARQAFANAIKLDNHNPTLNLHFAFSSIMCKNYNNDVLEIMKKLTEMPSQEKNRYNLNSLAIDCAYQYALEQSGRTEELNQLLRTKQEKSINKALEKNRKQIETLKTTLEKTRRQEEQRQRQIMTFDPSKKTNKTNTGFSSSTTSTTSTSSTTSTLPSQMPSFFAKENDSSPPLKKEKKKTRGEPNKGMAVPEPTKEQLEEPQQLFIHIEQLTDNKNARKTFDKIFSLHQRGNTFDNEVQISLHEMNTFFKALKQHYDPSKGKGAHKKATLNFQDYGSDMEEQMLTLTKSTYLKEYQIKQIREAFINGRIIPDDQNIIKVLKKDFPDLMK